MIEPVQQCIDHAYAGLIRLMVSPGKDKDTKLVALVKKLPGRGAVIAHDSDSAGHLTDLLDDAYIKSAPCYLSEDPGMDDHGFDLRDRAKIAVTEPAAIEAIPKIRFSFVIHWCITSSITDYCDHINRLFTGEKEMFAVLLFDPDDRYIIEENISKQYRAGTQRYRNCMRDLETVTEYATSEMCRPKFLSRYSVSQKNDSCGFCDSCRKSNSEKVFEEFDQHYVKVILRCVAETREKFGVNVLSGVLRGTLTGKAAEYRLDRASTFGALKDLPAKEIKETFSELLKHGVLRRTHGTYSSLYITRTGREQLGSTRINELELPKQAAEYDSEDVDRGLLEFLRNFRRERARTLNIQAFMLFNDTVLLRIAREKPVSHAELMRINGFGKVKWELIGEELLSLLRNYRSP